MKKFARKLITVLLVITMLVPSVATLYASAATTNFDVELAFNNIFVFDKWANNKLSSTVINNGVPITDKNNDGLDIDIRNGSFRFTKFDMASPEFYTAFSMDKNNPVSNVNYYMMDVKPDTAYTFFYNLSGTVENFTPYVFFYTEEGLYHSLFSQSAQALGNNSFEFTTPENVTQIQVRFTIADSSSNRPNVESVYADVKDIAICEYSAEEDGENLFDFNGWATNEKTPYPCQEYGYIGGTVVTDSEEESITITTNDKADNLYTNFTLSTDPAVTKQFYMIEVNPNSTYIFSYDLVDSDLRNFQVWIAMYDSTGAFKTYIWNDAANLNGHNSFEFTTTSDAYYIQVVFAVGHGKASPAWQGTVKNIKINSKINNLFDINAWMGNANSNSLASWAGYDGGSLTADKADKSITLTTNSSATFLFTNFTYYGMDPAFNSQPRATQFASVDVDPNSTYSCSYNLSDCNFPVGNFWVYIAEYKEDGSFITYGSAYVPSRKGENSFTFTTKENTSRLLVVFAINHMDSTEIWSATVKDIVVCTTEKQEVPSFLEITGHPHRQSFTYGNNSTYGTLPTPTYVPEGYVFAGWYTGIDGTGNRITENTSVAYTSYTVYPKYEPVADSISIKTMPAKTTYSVGERVNPTGLVLEAVFAGEKSTIESGYYCTPEYLTSTGTQTITVRYGGKTATYTVNVSASLSKSVVVNGANTNVNVTNNVYKFTTTVANTDFHRYKMTYYSDAYVEGIITYGDNTTEQFFLEPSSNFDDGNGTFTSFVDGYLKKHVNASMKMSKVTSTAKKGIKSISFTLLDNKAGTFELLSVTTEKVADMPATMTNEATVATNTIKYFQNDQYKVGVDILNGGAVYQLYLLNSDIVSRVYTINGKDVTKVDYRYKLDAKYGTKYKSESTTVNLINCYDNGRELQQSYYGTGEKPYEQGYYNSADWNYNPVQAGNVVGEASKVIDYEIGENYIYIKARPLDWAKWSDEWATNNPGVVNSQKQDEYYEPIHGDDYVTDTYIEAKYVFEDGLIKTYCRMVDYSGLPSAQTTQELPAFYTIEPLNQYVYNNVSAENAWQEENLVYDSEPEFWGITQDYINNCYPNGFSANKTTSENWAAFMASQDADSFGIGLYSPEVTDFYYGVYPPKHSGASADNWHYRHAMTLDPATEVNTSYIAPIGVREFSSYTPTEYEFYISTGTVNDIRTSFGVLGGMECEHKNTHTEHKDSTCTEEGYDKIICDICTEEISVTVLPVAEHTYETITTEPTCTDNGFVTCVCKVCGYNYVSDTISSLGHSALNKEIKTPTTRTEGAVNWICSTCNQVVEAKVLPVILLSDNSIANIDFEANVISGFVAGATSVDDYLSSVNGYTFTCGAGKIGTGAVITLAYEDELSVDYKAVIYGDVNGDGWYDGQDAIIVECIVNGMLKEEDVDEAVWMAADCNHDGAIDRLDVALLHNAGILLANVDQSQPAEVLLETSAAYVEYISLIDQSPDIEIEDDVTTPDVNDDVESDDTADGFDFMSVIEMIFELLKNLFTMVLSFIIG